jgi:hypothetical protein
VSTRRRWPQGTELVDSPPVALRRFDDPSWRIPAEQLGQAVYGSRDAWLAARAEWAAEHGLTVMEWWDALVQQVIATAETLDDLSMPFGSEYLIQDDDETDPRAVA